jgi:DNA-binding response OmpR family regulator
MTVLAEEPGEALIAAREETIGLTIVSLGSGAFDGLRLCSQARSTSARAICTGGRAG